VREVCETIHHKSPATHILLLGIFPRGSRPDDLLRIRIAEINRRLQRLNGTDNITFLDIGATFLSSDGTISPDIMADYLHPNAKGYGLWAAAMEPTLAELMREKPAARIGGQP
jgi:beta-glucosidase